MDNQFTRLKIVIGQENLNILSKKHVAIFGLGGVGGFVCEALARSNIGTLTIVDFDTVDITNINRQIISDVQNVGKYKTDLFEDRLKKINPEIKINKITNKYLPENYEEFFSNYDYIVDAIDIVTSKIHLIKTAYEKNIKIISSMGMGNKMDPLKIQITTLDKTSMCKLARVMRKELKKYDITKLVCAYSTENINITEKNIVNKTKMINGSTAFVPSVAGISIASYVVRDFLDMI